MTTPSTNVKMKVYHTSIFVGCVVVLTLWLSQLTYSLWPALLVILAFIILLRRHETAWLVLMPALWPVIDLVPSTGRMYFTESDALATLCIAVQAFNVVRQRAISPKSQDNSSSSRLAGWLLVCVALSYFVSTLQALTPLPQLDENAFVGYNSPFNSLRLSKGIVWPLLLLPYWISAQRQYGKEAVFNMLRVGMTIGLASASFAALWERLAFLQLLDFASDYRTTALFWEMNVGGAAFDGWLMLTLPFAVHGMLEAKRPLAVLLHMAALALGAYAVLTTFSRGVYLGVAVMALVAAYAWWRARSRIHPMLSDTKGWRRHLIAPIIFVAATSVAIAVFHGGGYRGLATLFASGIAVYFVGGLLRPMDSRQWLPLFALASLLWIASYLLHDQFYKAAYELFGASLATVLAAGFLVWIRQDDRHSQRFLAIATLWCAGGTGWINLHWGGSEALPAGAIASSLLVSALVLQTIRPKPLWTLTREHVTATVLCSFATAMIAVGAGSYFIGARFATTNEDTTGRLQHWQNGLSLIQNAKEWAIGIGTGRYANRYSLLIPSDQHTGAWRIGTENTPPPSDQNRYLRLIGPEQPNGRHLLRITQNIGLDSSGPFTVKLRSRAPSPATLHIEVCQKHLLYPGQCATAGYVTIPAESRWVDIERPMSNLPLAEHGIWFTPRTITFAVAINNDHGQRVDVDDLELIDAKGTNLLANRKFNDTFDHWFFTSDRIHLPYHAKSLIIHLLIEQGVFGAFMIGAATMIALWRLTLGRAREENSAPTLLAALVGFLTVGLFDSLLDVPRLAVFFYLLLGIAIAMKHQLASTQNATLSSAARSESMGSVTAKPSHPCHPRRLLHVSAALVITVTVALWVLFRQSGYTPQELIDHAETRINDMPRIRGMSQPAIAHLRTWFDLPSQQERLQRPFIVPPPPPLVLTTIEATEGPTMTRTLRVGKSGTIQTIAEASRIARDGDIVEIEAGEYHADVARWSQKNLTIRGVGGNARLFADGASAEGKAIWVIRNGDFKIENIDFIGVRVHDRNGAGIRFENGHLKVKNCLFWNNQNGILTASGDAHSEARLEIENSEFGYNGAGDGLSHNVYAGKIALLRITGSYFHHANVGHLLKSRAAKNEILYSRLTDESGGRSSYEIDFPNGGIAVVMGSIIQKSPEAENSTLISYGREGYAWPTNQLYLASNTLVNDHPHGGAFLRTAEGVAAVISTNNLLIGKGKYHVQGVVTSTNDIEADWEVFEQASRYDYRLAKNGQRMKSQPPVQAGDDYANLTPERQYVHPMHVTPISNNLRYPGALQTTKDESPKQPEQVPMVR